MKDEIRAIDIEIPADVPTRGATAWYRIPKDFKEFLAKCHEKHGIIGFHFEKDSFNFGVICKDEE